MGERSAVGPIRVLIVDDEPIARRTIRRLLERDDEVEVVGETFGTEAPRRIEETRPDLVFLDVQMPQLDGFQVLEEVPRARLPLVVFVTGYDEYAIRAFERRALDYLLKPFTDRRLLEALTRAKDVLRRRDTEDAQRRLLNLLIARQGAPASAPGQVAIDASPAGPGPGRLVVRDGARTVVLATAEISWLEASGSYVRVHRQTASELLRVSLANLAERLEAGHFFRIHRSALVNLSWVAEVRPSGHGDATVVLRDGTELRLSRTRRAEFEAYIGADP